jgi:hypothetical protein
MLGAASVTGNPMPVDFGAMLRADPGFPVESAGAAQITTNMLGRLEWLANCGVNGTAPVELVARLTVDGNAAPEALSGAARDFVLAEEAAAGQCRDSGVSLESTGGLAVSLDAVVPIETAGLLSAHEIAVLEAGGTVPAALLSVEPPRRSPGRIRIVATPGRLRLLKRP